MGDHESFTRLLEFSVLPIAKVLVMCTLGLLMATKYINILSASARKQLSQLVFKVFLPCLIFTELGKAITLENILQWWFIPVNVVISSTLGCLVGLIVALLVKPPPGFFKFTVVMIGVGNIGNIPLVLIGAICRDKNNPFGDPDTCETDGVAYISFGQWVGAVIVYTYVYQMLAPPDNTEAKPVSSITDASSVPLLVDVNEASPESGSADGIDSPKSDNKTWVKLKSWLMAARVQDILQPPVAASILAMIFGVIPFLKKLFLNDDAVFYFLTDGMSLLGAAMIPCIMLVLGGNLVKGPGSSQLGLRTTVTITLVRLLVIPPMGIGVVLLADKLNFLPPNDKMFRFVLLLQHSMPTSILAGAVTNLRGYAAEEASAILFWEHVASVVTMTGWLSIYVNFLF